MEVSWENHRTKWMGWEFPELAKGAMEVSFAGRIVDRCQPLRSVFTRPDPRGIEAMSTVQD